LGDADDEVQVGLDGLVDRGGRERRRHVDDGNGGACLLFCLFYGTKNRNRFERLARLLGVDAGDIAVLAVGVFLAHLGVELTGLAGDALRHHAGILVDQDAHRYFPFTAATTFSPACAMLSTEMIGRPESLRICLPRSSLVPRMRTTSGTPSFTSRAAATTPAAMVSHFMMPPKIFTRIAF